MSFLVYDLEIVKGIIKKGEEKLEDIEYCKGWHDHEGMGVSVIGAYDSVQDTFRVFCADNFGEFEDLMNDRGVLVSFNGVGFDNKVLTANEINVPEDKCYDILREIWICCGYNPDKFYWKTHGGFGLDAMAEANYLGGKTGHGALAPVDWQRGNIGAVIDYCLQDVRLTRDLFRLLHVKELISPKGGIMKLREVLK